MSWKWNGWENPKGWGKGWSYNWEGWGYPKDEDEEDTFYVPGIGRVRGKSLLDYTSKDLPADFYDDVPNYKIVDGHVVSDD